MKKVEKIIILVATVVLSLMNISLYIINKQANGAGKSNFLTEMLWFALPDQSMFYVPEMSASQLAQSGTSLRKHEESLQKDDFTGFSSDLIIAQEIQNEVVKSKSNYSLVKAESRGAQSRGGNAQSFVAGISASERKTSASNSSGAVGAQINLSITSSPMSVPFSNSGDRAMVDPGPKNLMDDEQIDYVPAGHGLIFLNLLVLLYGMIRFRKLFVAHG